MTFHHLASIDGLNRLPAAIEAIANGLVGGVLEVLQWVVEVTGLGLYRAYAAAPSSPPCDLDLALPAGFVPAVVDGTGPATHERLFAALIHRLSADADVHEYAA